MSTDSVPIQLLTAFTTSASNLASDRDSVPKSIEMPYWYHYFEFENKNRVWSMTVDLLQHQGVTLGVLNGDCPTLIDLNDRKCFCFHVLMHLIKKQV